MKTTLKLLSALLFIASIGLWVAHGAHRGWTTTEHEIRKTDEITGIEYSEYEKKLTLGVELPVVGTIASVLLLTASIFIKKPNSSQPSLSK